MQVTLFELVAGDAASQSPAAPAANRLPGSWVPIRSLAPRHRERITHHLMELPEHDRYLRFGYAASDGQIEQYAQQINFDRDEVLGIFNRRLRLLAMAHLAMSSTFECRFELGEWIRLYGKTRLANGAPCSSSSWPHVRSDRSACFRSSVLSVI